MTDLITLTEAETASISANCGAAAAVVAAAHDLTVESAEQAERASGILRDLATVRKRAESARKELTQPYRQHERQINDQFREPSAMLDEADGVIRSKVLAYQREQERVRAERQRELDRIAAEQRAADEAERARLAAEARAQREAWEAAQAKAKASDDEAAAEAARQAAEAMAQLERAREIAPLPVHAVQTAAPVKPSEGVAVKRWWRFEIKYPESVPRAYLVVDAEAIRRVMREDVRAGRDPQPIPGVRFYRDERLAVRGR